METVVLRQWKRIQGEENEVLTLETSALELLTVANLSCQLS